MLENSNLVTANPDTGHGTRRFGLISAVTGIYPEMELPQTRCALSSQLRVPLLQTLPIFPMDQLNLQSLTQIHSSELFGTLKF